MDSVIRADEQLNELLQGLETCAYEAQTLQTLLEKIQGIVDELNLRSFVNMGKWVAMVDSEVERRLASRLQVALDQWATALEFYGIDKSALARGTACEEKGAVRLGKFSLTLCFFPSLIFGLLQFFAQPTEKRRIRPRICPRLSR